LVPLSKVDGKTRAEKNFNLTELKFVLGRILPRVHLKNQNELLVTSLLSDGVD
jgi:hypothetical protein